MAATATPRIPAGHSDSPLLAAPVAGMARSYEKAVRPEAIRYKKAIRLAANPPAPERHR